MLSQPSGRPGPGGGRHSAGVAGARAWSQPRQPLGAKHSRLPLQNVTFITRLVTIADSNATDAGRARAEHGVSSVPRAGPMSPANRCLPCLSRRHCGGAR
ncbi:hypothetical protein G6F51_014376 [Rhizopus arrhizus]|uniref:Uncharacterized protein n=1 Tax=Rhizopus oryzae TaxID=64495 RepID=A0A9P6XMR5_RHIOR|nr:hypothetical protein G6F51_014376 [Rhizopus arrhizus]